MTATRNIPNWNNSDHVTISATPFLCERGQKRSRSPPKKSRGTACRGAGGTSDSITQALTKSKGNADNFPGSIANLVFGGKHPEKRRCRSDSVSNGTRADKRNHPRHVIPRERSESRDLPKQQSFPCVGYFCNLSRFPHSPDAQGPNDKRFFLGRYGNAAGGPHLPPETHKPEGISPGDESEYITEIFFYIR